ncbi:MAG TPA: hypothetical protein VJH97_05705 [Candidatus Nanoarchaeia archaeon]|nr:hypothetical protein [Candidatus Nanoarchaeia archaeon]
MITNDRLQNPRTADLVLTSPIDTRVSTTLFIAEHAVGIEVAALMGPTARYIPVVLDSSPVANAPPTEQATTYGTNPTTRSEDHHG